MLFTACFMTIMRLMVIEWQALRTTKQLGVTPSGIVSAMTTLNKKDQSGVQFLEVSGNAIFFAIAANFTIKFLSLVHRRRHHFFCLDKHQGSRWHSHFPAGF